jgi:poly(A) polymerase
VTDLPSGSPRILPRAEHPISRDFIDKNALKVLYRLHHAGYRALLVGGSVRDLMLGRQPKDFDIATDAKPNEIRRVFRNARIIGRRFRLAHILFPEGVVEVTTFRRDPTPDEQARAAGVAGEGAASERDLLITSDNTFGTPEQDAYRRDFTVNALYYDIADFSVVDYVGGIDDLQQGLIRAIGDPNVRFQEDPVRMVRACEFAARLDCTIEFETQRAIEKWRGEIRRASPARMAEEVVQLLKCGHAGRALQWMADLGKLEILLPEAYAMVAARERGIGDFGNIVTVVDHWRKGGRELSDAVVLACLLVPGVLLRREEIEQSTKKPITRKRLETVVEEIVAPFVGRFAFSNQRTEQLNAAILSFSRMCEPGYSAAERVRFAHRASFADGLDLFRILVESTGEGHEALAEWVAAGERAQRSPRAATAEPARGGRPAAGTGGRPAGKSAPRRRRRRPRAN